TGGDLDINVTAHNIFDETDFETISTLDYVENNHDITFTNTTPLTATFTCKPAAPGCDIDNGTFTGNLLTISGKPPILTITATWDF
ncbi:MAG: hypothetical protein ACTSPB_16460, partial [Candidatus Thorarchaeota archaeon]